MKNSRTLPGFSWSLLAEALGLLDGEQQLLPELLQAPVGRQVQAVEAVRTRAASCYGDCLMGESTTTITTTARYSKLWTHNPAQQVTSELF